MSLSFIGLTYAHQGRTDSKGGHWNHSTITYHCHTCNSNSFDDLFDVDYLNKTYSEPCKYRPKGVSKEECFIELRYTRWMFLIRLMGERLGYDEIVSVIESCDKDEVIKFLNSNNPTYLTNCNGID